MHVRVSLRDVAEHDAARRFGVSPADWAKRVPESGNGSTGVHYGNVQWAREGTFNMLLGMRAETTGDQCDVPRSLDIGTALQRRPGRRRNRG